jgi:hypothetical protein
VQTFPSSYAAGSAEEAVAKSKDRMVARALFSTENQAFTIDDGLKHIPKFAQSQHSLEEQLTALRAIAYTMLLTISNSSRGRQANDPG